MNEKSEGQNAPEPPLIAVVGSAIVVLRDGANIRVKGRALFKKVAKSEDDLAFAISSYLETRVGADRLTLVKFASSRTYKDGVGATLKDLSNAVLGEFIGAEVLSPPVPGFAEAAKSVTAILASGETVKITLTSNYGNTELEPVDLSAVYKFLSKQKLSDLNDLERQLNAALRPRDDQFKLMVLGFEHLGCCCNAS